MSVALFTLFAYIATALQVYFLERKITMSLYLMVLYASQLLIFVILMLNSVVDFNLTMKQDAHMLLKLQYHATNLMEHLGDQRRSVEAVEDAEHVEHAQEHYTTAKNRVTWNQLLSSLVGT